MKTVKRTTTHKKKKLALRREAIAVLTLPQLDQVAGGASRCSWLEPRSCTTSDTQSGDCGSSVIN